MKLFTKNGVDIWDGQIVDPVEFAENFEVMDDEGEMSFPYRGLTLTVEYSQIEINTTSRTYLKSTDWYASRLAENGTAIPADILDKRDAARAAIID